MVAGWCSDGNFDDEYFKGTDESNQFHREYEMRKMKQAETLKNMASDMNEVDRANTKLNNTNVRLKETETVLQIQSQLDMFLLCVILGIAAYLY
ncbi:hypothetical protein ABZP36_013915, partial [Zizania latifolia]